MTLEDFRKNEKFINMAEEIAKLDREEFNIFKILGLSDHEIRHSNFLKWLLGSDRFKTEFLKKFISVYDGSLTPSLERIKAAADGEDLSDIKITVNREEHFNEINENGNPVFLYKYKKEGILRSGKSSDEYSYYTLNTENGKVTRSDVPEDKLKDIEKKTFSPIGRYIDINITGDDFTLTIENKIFAHEHSFQCRAYRNYVLKKYEGKSHYFILLRPDKPDDFDKGTDENDGRYPGYVYMDYEMINDVLTIIKPEFNEFEQQIAEQYGEIIKEWKEIPPKYIEILSNLNMKELASFGDYTELNKLIVSEELSDAEKRFAMLARKYYLEIKARFDDIILNALENVFKSVNSDYDVENYARNVRMPKKNDGCYAMNTIDFRAPIQGTDSISIAVIAGLAETNSKKLSGFLSNIKFIEAVNEKKKDSNVPLVIDPVYYIYNGSGMASSKARILDTHAELPCPQGTKSEKLEELFSSERIGMYYADRFFSTEYLEYLVDLKNAGILTEANLLVSTAMEKYLGKGTDADKAIERVLDRIDGFLSYKGLKAKFESYLAAQKHPVLNTEGKESIKSILGKLLDNKPDDKTMTAIENVVWISLFNKWIGRGIENDEKDPVDNEVTELFKKLDIEVTGIETIDNISGNDDELKKMLRGIFDGAWKNKKKRAFVKKEEKKGKKKEEKIEDTLLKRLREMLSPPAAKCLRFGWELVITYQLTKEEQEKVNEEAAANKAGGSKSSSPTLEKIFRDRTLEILELYGYDEKFKKKFKKK